MSKAAEPFRIHGQITAQPNPPLPGSCTKIIWETNDPLGAEVHVSTPKEGEKLVSRGPSGFVEVDWMVGATSYDFELHGLSDLERCLDRVTVRPREAASNKVAAETAKKNIDLDELARLVAETVPRCIYNERFYQEFFRLWEEHGFHVTPVHFYQPIPDTRTLPDSLWEKPSQLVGIDMNDAVQLDLLRNCFPRFREEYEQFSSAPGDRPNQFHFGNDQFSGTDALVAYCMVRHFQPRLIIEVGGGYSSLVSAQAAARNNSTKMVCIEPFPRDFLVAGFPGLNSLIRKKIEEVDLDYFSQLKCGDILFIDSSHTVKIGGDVNYLFLEVLPRLSPGVIVHIHDILFPYDYRRDWVMNELRFWGEQYLLQAFLMFNSQFEILLCNSYLADRYLEDFKATFPTSPWWGGGSFWMRRKVF